MKVGVGPAGIPPLATGGDGAALGRFVARLDALGYDALCVGDHLDRRGAPLAVLAAVAAWSPRLTLAAHVLCAEFRNPAVLAHEVRTVQVLSEGRVELGLGVGWLDADFAALGVVRRPFRERLAHLAATVARVREAATGPFGPPPIVAGGGGRSMLTTAAELADIVTLNIPLSGAGGLGANSLADGTRSLVEERIALVRAESARHGREVALHLYVHAVHTGPGWREAAVDAAGAVGLDIDEYLASPHVLAGEPSQMAGTLRERHSQLGVGYVSIPGGAAEDFAPALGLLR